MGVMFLELDRGGVLLYRIVVFFVFQGWVTVGMESVCRLLVAEVVHSWQLRWTSLGVQSHLTLQSEFKSMII